MTTFHENEPNPPNWPSSVLIFHPSSASSTIQSQIIEKTRILNHYKEGHFSDDRLALLFAPGYYDATIDFIVGYYVQVAGLGNSRTDVVFEKGPYCPAMDREERNLAVDGRDGLAGSLDTFWRCGENFTTERESMMWAASQVAPLRNIHVKGDLVLHDEGLYASGGFVANSRVDGVTDFGSQQQYLSRDVDFGNGVKGGAWSLVFVDCDGVQKSISTGAVVSEGTSNVRMEKPYIVLQGDHQNGEEQKFSLVVPKAIIGDNDTSLHPMESSFEKRNEIRDFSRVKVSNSSEANVTRIIQDALNDGKDIVLSPGLYHLERTLELKHPNQVILGLGLATLIAPKDGSACIHVPPFLKGIRIAGLMLEASYVAGTETDVKGVKSLLEWGNVSEHDPGDVDTPGLLTDVFVRVGGSDLNRKVSTDVMIRLNSGNILGDNLWLWRADHAKLADKEKPTNPKLSCYHLVGSDEYPVKTGLEVRGDNVLINGLAVEHTNEHQVIWLGANGKVNFYQCELPYDVDIDYAKKNFLGYKVHESVREHEALGVGVYSYFRDHDVYINTAIQCPDIFKNREKNQSKISITNAFTVKLNGLGGIASVVNGSGPAVKSIGDIAWHFSIYRDCWVSSSSEKYPEG